MAHCPHIAVSEIASSTHRVSCRKGSAVSRPRFAARDTPNCSCQWRGMQARVCRNSSIVSQSYDEQTSGKSRARDADAEEQHRSSAPPPPPPPPPPPRKQKASRGFPLWGTIIGVLVAGGLWWGYIDSQVPEVYRDKDGMQYMLTKAGNQVLVGEDTDGRVYFIDKAGNFYYDSGDANVGIYVVTADNLVYNLFDDGSGERQQVYVGTFEDLKTQKVAALGGVPVEKLRQAMAGFDGTVTGFDVPATGEAAPDGQDFADRPVPTGIIEYDPDLVLEGKERR